MYATNLWRCRLAGRNLLQTHYYIITEKQHVYQDEIYV